MGCQFCGDWVPRPSQDVWCTVCQLFVALHYMHLSAVNAGADRVVQCALRDHLQVALEKIEQQIVIKRAEPKRRGRRARAPSNREPQTDNDAAQSTSARYPDAMPSLVYVKVD